ncbi:MAG: CHASE2 domain-containing protein [Terriglobia bacterium]
MKFLHPWAKSKWVQALALGLASGLLVLGAGRLGWLETIERKSLDWRVRALTPQGLASRDIVIVALDDTSFSSQDMIDNFGRWPWRRKLYGGLVHYLNEWGAKVVGLDLIFQGADPHAGDDALLAAALAERPSAVLAFALNMSAFREKNESASIKLRERLDPFALTFDSPVPLALKSYSGVDLSQDEFLKAAPRAGCITVQSDPDGPVRSATPLFFFRNRYYPSFSLAVAARARGMDPEVSVAPPRLKIAGRELPIDRQGRLLIRWYGPAYKTYRHYSVWQVFNSALAYENGEKPEIPPETFKDKIALIGATAASASDLLSNPYSETYPGVEVHATLIDNLLRGDFLRAAGEGWTTAGTLGLGLAMAGVVYLVGSALTSTILAMLLGGAYFASVCGLFRWENLWAPMVAPLAAGVISFTGATLTRYATEGREKRRYRRTLTKYLSPQLVETIMQDFSWDSLRAEKRTLTVLFSDIRGFTSISEKLAPEAVVKTLNEHLNMMVSVIFKHQGTLDKFVGDCVMAFWGAPLPQPNHAELAARAALEMIAGLEKLNQKWQSEGRPQLQIGVGINTGDMLFGNIGSEQRMDFTVIGDSVNLGSRLESSTKELHATIVISDATYQMIRDRAEVRPLGAISVKGKEHKIVVYELLGMKDSAAMREAAS